MSLRYLKKLYAFPGEKFFRSRRKFKALNLITRRQLTGAAEYSDSPAFKRLNGDFAERSDEMIKGGKAFVVRKTAGKAEIDLLGDDRELEGAENVVKKNVGNRFAGFLLVYFDEFRARDVFHQNARIKRHRV